MTDSEQPKGLSLRGDLQIDITEQALLRHKADSKALAFIVRLKDTYAQFPEHLQARSSPTSMSFYVDDAAMRQDVLFSLRKSLELDDLDEYTRVGIEELLLIQESDSDL